MNKTFKKAVIAGAMAAVLGVSVSAPAALATPTPIALDPASKFATWACEPTNLGLGNLNFTTLEITQASGTNNECEGATGYYTSAFNPIDAYVYSIDYEDAVLSRTDVRGTPINFPSGRTKTITGATGSATVLGINPRTGAAFVADATKLYSLDLATGVVSSPVTIGFALNRLAYSPSGTLYATDTDGKLMTVNTSTGATVDVVNMRDTCGNNRPKGIAFDAAGTLFFIDIDGVVCSAKVTNFAGTVARFTSTLPASNDSAWVGSASNTISGGPIVITYGNLKVNFKVNGGRALSRSSSPFYADTVLASLGQTNSTITLPRPTRSGYTFNGWFDAASGGTLIGEAGDSYVPASNSSIDMYAQWTRSSGELANTGKNWVPLEVAGFAMVALGVGIVTALRRRNV